MNTQADKARDSINNNQIDLAKVGYFKTRSKAVDSMSAFISKVKLKDYIDMLFERSVMPHQRGTGGYTPEPRKSYYEGKQAAYKEILSLVELRK